MALTYSEMVPLEAPAPSFRLIGVDGGSYGLADFSESRALVVAFICNHCPYVVAVQGRINALAREYQPRGVTVVGINANDSEKYPADGFTAMQARAAEQGYVFPYLIDPTQEVARAYGAVCTPDFFVFGRSAVPAGDAGAHWALRYRGRLDDNWKDESAVKTRDLAVALDRILAGEAPGPEQHPAMGCSIKWK